MLPTLHAPTPPPTPMGATAGLLPRSVLYGSGTCGRTSSGEGVTAAHCLDGDRGSWPLVGRLAEHLGTNGSDLMGCVQMCARCQRCAFVSWLDGMDCSWYSACDSLQPLKPNRRTIVTIQVRPALTPSVRKHCGSPEDGPGRRILYLHFSKSGGTHLCKSAADSNCSSWGTNCAARSHADGPWWVAQEDAPTFWHKKNFARPLNRFNRSCEMRRQIAPSFHAIESVLPHGQLCAGFFTMTLLVPPMDRMQSQAFELLRWGFFNHFANETGRPYPLYLQLRTCSNYTHLRQLSPVTYDNYYIRTLLGERVHALPAGEITADHLHRAKALLDQMDLVLVTVRAGANEAIKNATGIVTQFEPGLKKHKKVSCPLDEADWAAASSDNALDMQLFEHAVKLHDATVRRAKVRRDTTKGRERQGAHQSPPADTPESLITRMS